MSIPSKKTFICCVKPVNVHSHLTVADYLPSTLKLENELPALKTVEQLSIKKVITHCLLVMEEENLVRE